MRTTFVVLLHLLLRDIVALVCLAAPAEAASGIALQLVASGVPYLVDVQHAGSGARLFLVSQPGQILIFNGSQVLPTPFLNLSSIVSFLVESERGLLGLAFHPDYATNGFFFVLYTSKPDGDIVVARYQVSANPDVADAASGVILLTAAPHPRTNHNGGQLRFGPDGFLYVALGDGAVAPQNSQDLTTLLGKLLRLDVDSGAPYIPPDNPFVGTPGARGEIWALGLRNPWRFSFDRQTGDLFVADVGQNLWEEVSMQPAAGGGGRNYGWDLMEGRHCYNPPPSGCNNNALTLPIVEYAHALGCSITGGFRYRGAALADYVGTYVFGDLCNGIISGATVDTQGVWHVTQLLDTTHSITTFGEDAAGELYVSHYSESGQLYRLVPATTIPVRLSVTRITAGTGRITSSPTLLECGDVCAAELATGTVVTLVASADGGPVFWAGDPDCVDGTVTMTGDRACTARFEFTDNTLAAGTSLIRAVHITELRSRIDALRAGENLLGFAWSDSTLASGATIVQAVYVMELRAALNQVYSARKQTSPDYTDAALAGIVIKAVHIRELRNAVLALESSGSSASPIATSSNGSQSVLALD